MQREEAEKLTGSASWVRLAPNGTTDSVSLSALVSVCLEMVFLETVIEMYNTGVQLVFLIIFFVGFLTGTLSGIFLWGRFKC